MTRKLCRTGLNFMITRLVDFTVGTDMLLCIPGVGQIECGLSRVVNLSRL
jgi:hypothetical protein